MSKKQEVYSGINLSEEGSEKRVSLFSAVLVCVVIAVGAFVLGARAYMLPLPFSKTPSELDLRQLNSLYSELRNNYDGDIDVSKIIDGAKHGLVSAVDDPYTEYLSAKEATYLEEDLNGSFEGIGAELGKIDGRLTIMSVIADSPAQKAGLKAKDIIYKVNNEDVAGLSAIESAKKIRGEKGTTVRLSVLRVDKAEDYTIARDKITNPSVSTDIINNEIGYIRLSRFGDDSVGLMSKAADDMKTRGIKKIIFDLRDNTGGLFESTKDIAGLWLKNKVIVTEKRDGKAIDSGTLKSSGDATLEGVKTVVLVNGLSASASEIVAGALKDYKAATLVGEKTFGKGKVQRIIPLNDGEGGHLKVTIARWYTPNGGDIDKKGIQPDKEVKFTEEDIKARRDPQKDEAIKILNK